MTTANKLTLVRVALIPVFMIFLLIGKQTTEYIALAIYIIASLTDTLDGYIARHYNQVTDFGKFMDPLADKLLVTAAIIIFVGRGQMWSWAAVIILAREFVVTALRLIAANNGVVIAAAVSGKCKTLVSLISICIMMTPITYLTIGSVRVNEILVVLMLIVTVYSGAEYFVKNGKILTASK